MASGDDHRRTDLRDRIKVVGKGLQEMNAAMRRRVARQAANMERDALPRQPLHVRHRLAILDRGMGLGLLQDRKHPGWRAVTRFARRAGGDADQDAVAVNEHELLRHRDDDGHGPLGRPLGVPIELPRLKSFEVVAGRLAVLGE
jgi:hypothetical protein